MRAAPLSLIATLLLCSTVAAQFDQEDPQGKGIRFDKTQVVRYQVGVIVTAQGGPCQGIYCTVPVPMTWPEQQVKVVEEEKSSSVRMVKLRKLQGSVEQMLVSIPYLQTGETAKALFTYEITRRSLLAPTDPSVLTIPKRLDLQQRRYLGTSPYIEIRHAKIRQAARDSIAGKTTAWEQVEGMYDWVREKVEYKNGKLKGAVAALQDGNGDCEELTSLFIALCRVNKIPARTVWIPGHCYPEFLLADDEGKTHWIPCQAAGTKEFGGMSDMRPILQKGDNFKVPEKTKAQRYVAEYVTGKAVRGGGRPNVQFVRKQLGVPVIQAAPAQPANPFGLPAKAPAAPPANNGNPFGR